MNSMKLEFSAISENVKLARVVAAAFVAPLDPTVTEISDIKTAVSEAVTNAIIHGYSANPNAIVTILMRTENRRISIEISDNGVGIENIDAVREPLFTTKPEMERSGLGFTVMESFMDTIEIESSLGAGTTVKMKKSLGDNQ